MKVELLDNMSYSWNIDDFHGYANMNISTTFSGTKIVLKIWSTHTKWEDEYHTIDVFQLSRYDAIDRANKLCLKQIHAQYQKIMESKNDG